jgi:hypothetical protein
MAGTAGQVMNPEDIAPHEQFRIRMVDVAMKRIARHPNWCRGFGFAVGEDWWPEFLESLGAVKDEIGDRIEREAGDLERGGRGLARVPETLEVMMMAVFLLLAGRKAAWPLPVGAPITLEAVGRFVVAEQARAQVASASECDVVEREEKWGSGEMAGGKRMVH